ncbi:MAG: N-acetyltransferase family protein [Hymenobacteraceae bacterium]|nr:N-acetyltransferase family protein [Hymenobacteraceae bacterium]MDX5397340.1 N-acetyltransferase family protein [Hymenobacteraceae bacterium]MDX5443639.1 N-acetyltransferase family protein [Hymenobacteraceae bacterium]MDX5513419.1 N-acetyltransferase family protein [Hymenobacteraceae bacterium]
MLQVRTATLNDLPAIVDIYNATIPGRMVTADTEPVTAESRMDWFYSHTDMRPLLVATEGSEILGWLSFKSFYGRPAYSGTAEVAIYLRKQAQGKGYGNRLLQYILDLSPALHLHTLLGFIFAHNQPSLQLFKKFGFEQWGYLPQVAVLDGQYRDLVIVGRKVG